MFVTIRKTLSFGAIFLAGAAASTMLGASVLNSQPPDAAAIERLIAMGTPGQPHARLAASVGRWDVTSKYWMEPDGEPMTEELKSIITSEMGGLFVFERTKGGTVHMPYESLRILGYDNQKKKWTSSSIDNTGTATIYAEGVETEQGTIELFGTMYDPIMDEIDEFKVVVSGEGRDARKRTMFLKQDGEWFRAMETTYRRAGQ